MTIRTIADEVSLVWIRRSSERSLLRVAKQLTKVVMPTNLTLNRLVRLDARAA